MGKNIVQVKDQVTPYPLYVTIPTGSLVGVGSRKPSRMLPAVTAPGTSRGTQLARRRIRNAGLIIARLFIIIH